MTSFGFPCEGDCECSDCNCTDPYNTPGTGGASTACPFTGGAGLVIAGGVLEGVAGNTIVFENGPDDDIESTTLLTIVCKPDTAGGPSVIELRAGIQGGEYVYGRLTMSGSGDVTLSVGTNGGELAENDEAGTGGISDFVTLELCWDPPIDIGEIETAQGGADIASAGADWSNVDNILGVNDDTPATTVSSLGAGDTTSSIGVTWFPFLPLDSVITRIEMEVRCRENASPAEGIEDSSATVTAGSVGLSNKATSSPIPAPNFSFLSYEWTGGDLTGVTAADINDIGMSGGITLHMPIAADGGTQPDVDHIILAIFYTTIDRTPGRISFKYTNGAAVECISANTTDVGGGGFPGLSFITDNWDVTSTQIQCLGTACPECLEPFDCITDCCDDEGSDTFTEELTVSGFTTTPSVDGGCCGGSTFVLQANASPGNECSWQYRTDCRDEEDITHATQAEARLFRIGADCYWRVGVVCFDGLDMEVAVIYQSDAIVGNACDAFPITLNKYQTIADGGGTIALPATITLDNS